MDSENKAHVNNVMVIGGATILDQVCYIPAAITMLNIL